MIFLKVLHRAPSSQAALGLIANAAETPNPVTAPTWVIVLLLREILRENGPDRP